MGCTVSKPGQIQVNFDKNLWRQGEVGYRTVDDGLVYFVHLQKINQSESSD